MTTTYKLTLPPEPPEGTVVELHAENAGAWRIKRIDVEDATKQRFRWGIVRVYRSDTRDMEPPAEWMTWEGVWAYLLDGPIYDDPNAHMIVNPVEQYKRGDILTAAQARELGEGAVVRAVEDSGVKVIGYIALTRVRSGSGWSPYPPVTNVTYELLAEES